MKAIDLLETMGSIRDRYILEAQEPEKRRLSPTRTLLIAAIITAMAIFMGCAVAALSTKQLKLDEYETTAPAWIDADGERHEAAEVTKTVLSLQGLENTPEQKAAKEWLSRL